MHQNKPNAPAQFSLARLFMLFTGASLVAALFGLLAWPLAVLTICGLNAAVAIVFWFKGASRTATLALATALLFIATLVFTDWGLSRPNGRPSVPWPFLVSACLVQLGGIADWLLGGARKPRPPER